MRRRFGRRRRSGGGDDDRGTPRPIDLGWLPKLTETGLLPTRALEAVGDDAVPAHLALIGRGVDEEGRGLLVAFSPVDAGDALLGLVAHLRGAGATTAQGEGAEAAPAPTRAYVLSRWSAPARRRLALVGRLDLPVHPVEAGLLLDGPAVGPESAPAPAALPPARVVAQVADAATRALLERGVSGLLGLAAKHGGAVRGSGGGVDLVLAGQRAARLSVRDERVLLETAGGRGGAETLSADRLAESLDALEGALRKRVRDVRSGKGEDGLRARAQDVLAGALALRTIRPYPMAAVGGESDEPLDAVGLDAEGRAVAVAVRDTLGLAQVGPILDAWAAIQPTLPVLLGDAPPPVRLDAPRLVVAARQWEAPAVQVLEGLTVEVTRLDVHPGREGTVELVPAGTAPALPPAVSESGRDRREGGRRRGRGRRGPRRPRGEEGQGGEASAEEDESSSEGPSEADRAARGEARGDADEGLRGASGESEGEGESEDRPRFSELSSFDLDDSFGLPETETGGKSRRRRRRRGRRRSGGDGDDTGDRGDEDESPAGRATGGPGADQEPEGAEEAEEDVAPDEEEIGSLAEAPEPEVEEPLRQERPRRAAILSHSDRTSLAAAMLLAREARQVEGIWVYPQSELMTFFRSVATDLRDDVTIMVVGFHSSRDAIQAASLYANRLEWYDTRAWPPEDLAALRSAVGDDFVDVHAGLDSTMPLVLPRCSRRSRFSDKLVDLVGARFTEHDFQRWGRVWWWRLGDVASRPGEHKNELQPLLTGRPSELAAAARKAETPPPPPEVAYVGGRDFRIVHFGGHSMVVVDLPPEYDRALAGRVARERYGAHLSLTHHQGDGLVILGAHDGLTARPLDVVAMAEHVAEKHAWVTGLPMADHVARFRIEDPESHPDRLETVISEIGMGRSILEG